MPRSMQEILDHADELAQRFEDYEPVPGDEVDVAEYRLRQAAVAQARGERQVADAVLAAAPCGGDVEADRRATRHLGSSCTTALRPTQQVRLNKWLQSTWTCT